MQENFVLNAEVRNDQGKGASRRLRRTGKVPAVLYGGNDQPQALAVSANELRNHLKTEAFYSHILNLDIGGQQQQVVLKDLQRHPIKDEILHLDLYRILADKALRRSVPLHFVGAESAPGVKLGGGMIEHLINEIEIECLPKHLPEFIAIDVSAMNLNDAIHLSEVKLPEGVTALILARGKDATICSLHAIKVKEEAPTEAAASAEVPAANQKAPAAAAAPAKPAAKKK